jgi:hypothetical protein
LCHGGPGGETLLDVEFLSMSRDYCLYYGI